MTKPDQASPVARANLFDGIASAGAAACLTHGLEAEMPR